VSAKTKIAVSYIKGNEESSLDTAVAYLLGGVWLKNTVHSVNFEQTSMLLGADYLIGEQAVFYFDYNHLFDSQGHQFFALGLRLNF
jgi:hypothetical protein